MKVLTVITTTYNRSSCLDRLYESLLEQECHDFIWLVVDDGSTDDTKDKIKEWQDNNLVEIEYVYKENGGMHTARNLGYSLVHTELNTIIDSDDWMAPNAVHDIIEYWKANKENSYAGMITLNRDPEGNIIGTNLPENVKSCSYKDFWKKYQMRGDKKLVYRSELTKQFPYPEYVGEKFYPAATKFYMIDKSYDMLIADITTCIVNYNDDSMTRDKYAQYKSCPRSFMDYRKEMINIDLGIKENAKNMIHYVMEMSIAKEKPSQDIIKNPLFYICYLPGKLTYLYIIKTKKKY